MNLLALLSLASAAILLILGLFVYYQNPHNRVTVLFMVLCSFMAYEGFIDYNFRSAITFEQASLWLRFSISWVFSLSVVCHFMLTFTEKYEYLKKKRAYLFIYGPAVLFFLINQSTGVITGRPVKQLWGWDISLSKDVLFYLSTFWSLCVVIFITLLCYNYYKKVKDINRKKRVWYVLLGMLVGSLFAFTTALFLPFFGSISPTLVMPSYLLAFGFVGYGILKHKLFLLEPDTAADTIIETLSDLFLLINIGRKIEQVNPAAVTLLGYEEDELIGMPIKKVLPRLDKDLDAIISRVSKEEHQTLFVGENVESTLITKYGKNIPVILQVSLIYDNRNDLIGITCIARDCTEEKKAIEKQYLSEERFRLLVENAPMGIFSIDTDGTILDANQELLKMMDMSDIAMIKGFKIKSIPQLHKAGITGTFQQCLETGEKVLSECLCATRGDQEIYCKIFFTPKKDMHGTITGVEAIVEDITDEVVQAKALKMAKLDLEKSVEERTKQLKAANEELAEEKERLAVTLHSIGDGVVTTDNMGTIVMLNKVAAKLSGFPVVQAIGMAFNEVFLIERDGVSSDRFDPIAGVVSTGSVVSSRGETRLTSLDKVSRCISYSGAPIRDRSGTVIGVVFVMRDITETKRMEEELFKARRLESIGELAGGIASDFNSVLSNVMTNLFAAKMHIEKDSEAYTFFQEAEKAAFEASALTKQLITLSHDQQIITSRVSIQQIVEDSIGFLLSDSQVDYRLDFPGDLKEVEVDRGLMDQVIAIIIRNAEHAMPEGGTIICSAENVVLNEQQNIPLDPGDYIKIAVTDEGHGIAKTHLPKIFDPFFSTKVKGAGIGLSRAYVIIRRHEGYITISSEEGKGTTVIIYLPACEEEEVVEHEQ